MKKAAGVLIRWVVTLIFTASLTFLIWRLVIKRQVPQYTEPVSPVRIEKPVKSNLEQTLNLSGYVQVPAMIPVVPFVSGTVKEYRVSAGDFVEEGEILAIIDPEPYQLQLDQASAVYLASKSTFERVENLYKSGAVTQQNYDEAEAQYNAYKAQYELAKVQMNYTKVVAPLSGTILMENSAQGSVASSQDYIYLIGNLNNLEISLDIPERYFDLINKNKDEISAEVTRSDFVSHAVIKSVSPYISPQSKTFKLILRLTDNIESFRPGMFVSVSLVYNTFEDVYVLRRNIINPDGSIYVYNENRGTAVFLDLKPEIFNSEFFVVPDEYSDLYFITDGQNRLLDGKKVTVL